MVGCGTKKFQVSTSEIELNSMYSKMFKNFNLSSQILINSYFQDNETFWQLPVLDCEADISLSDHVLLYIFVLPSRESA